MLVPVRLARRPAAEPAAALLLPSAGVAELLAVCAHLNADPLPKVFATADGFLVLLDAPTPLPVPGAIRLRRLADYLLVPADADLEPQLHADEATALTKARGLVVLAGGRVLEFAPDSPIPAEELIAVGPVRREGWEPFPKRRYIADQLRAITYERPMDTPEDVLSPGGEGIGEEEPRPPATGAIQTAAGHAQAGFGQFLAKLGAALGWKSLKERGEQLVRGAMESVPRLQEDILGRQEAALRDLLRRFREGKIEEALRRALPIGDGSHRGEAAADANLPTHDLRYSLGNMFGGSGPASFWFGGADVQRDLMREYRRAAELAMQHGDFRRAAFIYGKLLADWRAAAAALARGGLHHDAAVLFRDKLQNSLRAAQEFEAGGEFDEALAIYDRIPNHELAGDLLLRMGEEDAATERYLTVANDLMDSGRGPLAAGEFILRKANRADLAEPFFAAGWAQRHRLQNARDAVPCALHLAKMTADREDAGPFLELLEEAETYFATDGQPVAAGAFFNVVAQLADRPPLRPRREELRDRCLLGIAGKLREHAAVEQRAGNIVSAMLGESGAWGPPQVRDASFALQAELARQERPRADRAETLVHLGVGTVTAAVQAPESGVLFVGGESGRVVAFEPRVGSVGVVDTLGGPVTALAVTVTGRYILAAHQQGPKLNLLNCYRLSAGGASTVLGDCSFPSGAAILLSPIVAFDLGELLAACRDRHQPTSFALFRGPDLRAGTVQLRVDPTADDWSDTASNPLGPSAELLFSIESNGSVSARLLSFDGGWLSYSAFRPQGGEILLDTSNITIDWTPAAHPESSIGTPLLSWLNGRDGPVEFTGLSAEKALYWLRVQLPPQEFRRERLLATGCPEGYRCAALLRPGMIAGVTASNRVIWLRAAADKLEEWRPPVKLGRTSPAVACFVSAATSELLVVLQNGGLLRVPLPS